MLQNVRQGQLRPLAVAGNSRSGDLPGIPTIKETGIGDFDASTTYAVFAPAGTPKEVVDRLHGEIKKALDDEDVQQKLRAAGVQPGDRLARRHHQDAGMAHPAMGRRDHRRGHQGQLATSPISQQPATGNSPCLTSSPSISAAPSPISSPAMSRPARSPTPRVPRPTTNWATRSSTASARPRSTRSDASFVKHGTTLVINALLQRVGRQDRAAGDQGLPRPAGDRPRQPHPAVQPALPPRAAAGAARAALRGRPSGWTAPATVRTPLALDELAPVADILRAQQVEALAISFLNSYLTPEHEQAAAAETAPAAARRLRHHRHRADARVARIRAHRDRRGQRLCRAAGQQVHRRIRRRPARAAASKARCC